MEKTAQQSLIDILIQIMPALQDVRARMVNKSDVAANQLYSMWSGNNKIANRKILKPANLEATNLKKMLEAGYVEDQGKYLKITEKGAQTLKVLILNDNVFEMSKKSSADRSGWYLRLKNEDLAS
jgi:predicted transcriptional regulator